MTISLIAAMSRNRVIGHKGALPWRLPRDLARFKKLTMGHWLLMGRKTFESLDKILPGRPIVVITRQQLSPEGVRVAHTLDEALRMAPDEEVFIAGGGEIYRCALPIADRLYLTVIDADFEGDTTFPEFDESQWELVESESYPPDEKNACALAFLTYTRRSLVTRPSEIHSTT